jgi:hypothetical protein
MLEPIDHQHQLFLEEITALGMEVNLPGGDEEPCSAEIGSPGFNTV